MRAPDFWAGRDPISRLAIALLTPIGWLYGASIAYRASHTVRYRSRCKVICVGNLTAGGAGKTPIAMEIARILIARGARPVFLSRGYGGKVGGPALVAPDDLATQIGDEPLLLAAVAPVIISRNRTAGARLAEKEGFSVIVMDDGHQNFSLEKDLSLVVIDAETGFGNNRVLPAGLLREPVAQGLKRADAIIVNGDSNPSGLAGINLLKIRARTIPVVEKSWIGQRVVGFAGIGQPEKFFSTLASTGARIVEALPFADHHYYTAAELAQMKTKASTFDAMLVTTEKDFARLNPAERGGIVPLRVRIEFNDREPLESLLDTLVPRGLPPQTE